MADVNWVDPQAVFPEDWEELSAPEQAAWTRGFMAGASRVLEKIMVSMATISTQHTEVDAEEAREFLDAVPKEALPDA